jgi:hypothetical protein
VTDKEREKARADQEAREKAEADAKARADQEAKAAKTPPPGPAKASPAASGYNPVAKMEAMEAEQREAEEKARSGAEEFAKAAASDGGPEPTGYVVAHAGVGGHGKGARVKADALVPVPKDAS